ncbi:hypothetical protein ACWDRB_62670 [Nonomuraea sp. NPDC003707]
MWRDPYRQANQAKLAVSSTSSCPSMAEVRATVATEKHRRTITLRARM